MIEIIGSEFNTPVYIENDVNLSALGEKHYGADKDFDLVFVGNVFKCEKYFKSVLMRKLKSKFTKINFKSLTKKPVEGAIKLALENL
ncbi:hypothetical protein ES705_01402 [subsurface metagenome]|uniref:Uncharacterized protein n=1 Tax=marine sediment metagenome TaxID=412755 RepID=X1DY57_9ZZZZ